MFTCGPPPRSEYDLNFKLFGIPTRFHPSFFILMAILTFSLTRQEPAFWIVGIVGVTLVFLIHELGHALAFKAFRAEPVMVFYYFSGMAIPDFVLPERWKRVTATLAGPFSGLAVAGLVYLSDRQWNWSAQSDYLRLFSIVMVVWSLCLNLFNLLPIYPLDGGQVMMEAFSYARPFNGPAQCLKLSMWLAGAYAAYSAAVLLEVIPPFSYGWFFLPVGPFTLIIFLMIAHQNWQLLERTRYR